MINKYRQQIIKELDNYHYELFVTVTCKTLVTTNYRNFDYTKAEKILAHVLGIMEHSVCGRHWKQNPIKFFAFLEFGKHGVLPHFHILIRIKPGVSRTDLVKGLDKAEAKINRWRQVISMDVQDYARHNGQIFKYCTKELNFDKQGHCDTRRINTAETLFVLPPPTEYTPSIRATIKRWLNNKKNAQNNKSDQIHTESIAQKTVQVLKRPFSKRSLRWLDNKTKQNT